MANQFRGQRLTKITTRGQIVIPFEIRKKLGLKNGDKLIFIEENERIIMEKDVRPDPENARNALTGEAKQVSLKAGNEAFGTVKELRSGSLQKDTSKDERSDEDEKHNCEKLNLLNTPVEDFHIKVRTYKSLKRVNINYLGDLLQLDAKKVKRLPGIDRIGLLDIIQ